jgi:hypothetical protein
MALRLSSAAMVADAQARIEEVDTAEAWNR